MDKFLLNEGLKTFKHSDIGFVIDDIKSYDRALASIRIRCYDMIYEFSKKGISAELYKPFKKYKAVVFTKTYSEKSFKIATRLNKRGTPIISDIYYDKLHDAQMSEDINRIRLFKLLEVSSEICTCSSQQQQDFMHYYKNVHCIPESVHDSFFEIKKDHTTNKVITLVYCGYSNKAKDVLCIADILQYFQNKYGCRLLFICEKDPDLSSLDYDYIEYDQKNIPDQLVQGDIMIAPRPMEGIETLAHSLTKIAYPMAVGLPVVASPVPSYLNTPAVICNNEEEWKNSLQQLITDAELRKKRGEEGRVFIKKFYSMSNIADKYLEIIGKYIKLN